MSALEKQVEKLARAAREASAAMAKAKTEQKDLALHGIAKALRAQSAAILSANRSDMCEAAKDGLSKAMLDRLMLDEARVEGIAKAVEAIALLADPVGELLEARRLANGLELEKRRSPLGVIAIVYEARPNVTVDAASLCLKAGNAVVLRGGREALRSNLALAKAVQAGLKLAGLPMSAVSIVASKERAAVRSLLKLDKLIDVVIPRGGHGLIEAVIKLSRIPVIRHDIGNCHVYVDQSADLAMAEEIVYNAKVSRPSVCNAMEHLLVHETVAEAFLKRIVPRLKEAGVELRGDAKAAKLARLKKATEAEWYEEYLDLICGIKIVPNLEAAIAHVNHYGSHHSDAIVSTDMVAAERFLEEVDSAAVYHNASTRFTDGGEFGLGAEIGISTQKLHARGPMALRELTSMKWILRGQGQVRV